MLFGRFCERAYLYGTFGEARPKLAALSNKFDPDPTLRDLSV